MNESVIISILGALAGLLPVFVTQLVQWFDSRSKEDNQKRSLDLAKRHIEFLDVWFRLQERLLEPEAQKDIKTTISHELLLLKQLVDENIAPQKNKQQAISDLPFIQRFFLAYRPPGIAGWVFRFIYYMFLGIFIAKILDDVLSGKLGLNESGIFSFGDAFGDIFGMVFASILLLSPIWYMANLFDLRAEKSSRPPAPSLDRRGGNFFNLPPVKGD